MNGKRFGKKWSGPNPGIYQHVPGGAEENHKNLSQYS
jgi:hypothetical protein